MSWQILNLMQFSVKFKINVKLKLKIKHLKLKSIIYNATSEFRHHNIVSYSMKNEIIMSIHIYIYTVYIYIYYIYIFTLWLLNDK